MANKKISDLPLQTSPTGSVEFEIENSGVSERVSLTNVLASTTAAYQSADGAALSAITALQTDKANLVSPTFTGTPAAPTAAAGTNTTQISTTAFATTADLLRLRLSGADLMTGTLQMNGNPITGVTAGTTGTTNACNVTQMETAVATKSSWLRSYDPTATSAFPTTWGGTALALGHRFYISVAGTMDGGGVTVGVGDIIEAIVAPFADNISDWLVHRIQADTSAKLRSIITDETGTGVLVYQ